MRWLMVALMAAACGEGLSPDLQAKFDGSCAACHVAGAADAPRSHARLDWDRRLLVRGHAGLLHSAQAGRLGMPARGRCADCSDADLRVLVAWMSQ